MTYGMAIALRKIQDRIDLNVNEWEDEKKIEEVKTKSRQTLTKKMTKLQEEEIEEQEQE